MANYYENAAEDLGANKAMLSLAKLGKVTVSNPQDFEDGIVYGKSIVAEGVAKGEITKLAAMQAEQRGGKSVRDEYGQ